MPAGVGWVREGERGGGDWKGLGRNGRRVESSRVESRCGRVVGMDVGEE